MDRSISERATKKLLRRRLLSVRRETSIAVKRDSHEFLVDVDAAALIESFRTILTSKDSIFGLIRVKRPAARLGQPFELGERFQGSFSLELLLFTWLGERRWLRRLLTLAPLRWLLDSLEALFLSNYGELTVMDLTIRAERPAELVYAYLEGTPIAGKSTFTIESLGPGRCRFTQILEYQEVNGISLATFQRFGLKFHDQVVHEQVRQAAALAGGTAHGTVEHAYATLLGAGVAS
jgi:hypothetical protein